MLKMTAAVAVHVELHPTLSKGELDLAPNADGNAVLFGHEDKIELSTFGSLQIMFSVEFRM